MSNTQLINVISNIERVGKDAHAQMSVPQLRVGWKAPHGPLSGNPRASFRTVDASLTRRRRPSTFQRLPDRVLKICRY
ncbi:hypothetical protein BN2476_240030 [Paraburkholderia piptadeniae]|uniref:Uncharacterized protein n=1 Tax=Paraburkholderia piptadeniae TaxID=1701573 RepID=A0A1N7RYH6_9BURK|nr:hypothetical protein BN2476_240030 [Paraburkholderia piptadeniae]